MKAADAFDWILHYWQLPELGDWMLPAIPAHLETQKTGGFVASQPLAG